MRTHYCGQVNAELAEQQVTLCGWVNKRRDLGGLIFIDLRDREGLFRLFLTQTKKRCSSRLRSYVRNSVYKLPAQ